MERLIEEYRSRWLEAFDREWGNMSEGDEMKWIPVSERLPEGDVRVLVLVNGAADIACLNWQYGWMYEDYGSLEPSHWMPLPEPPISLDALQEQWDQLHKGPRPMPEVE